ncbi:MAG: hypothetical protein ACOCUT_00140 [bacterium]
MSTNNHASKVLSKPVGIWNKYIPTLETSIRSPFYAAREKFLKSIDKTVFQILVFNLGELMWINVPYEECDFH